MVFVRRKVFLEVVWLLIPVCWSRLTYALPKNKNKNPEGKKCRGLPKSAKTVTSLRSGDGSNADNIRDTLILPKKNTKKTERDPRREEEIPSNLTRRVPKFESKCIPNLPGWVVHYRGLQLTFLLLMFGNGEGGKGGGGDNWVETADPFFVPNETATLPTSKPTDGCRLSKKEKR